MAAIAIVIAFADAHIIAGAQRILVLHDLSAVPHAAAVRIGFVRVGLPVIDAAIVVLVLPGNAVVSHSIGAVAEAVAIRVGIGRVGRILAGHLGAVTDAVTIRIGIVGIRAVLIFVAHARRNRDRAVAEAVAIGVDLVGIRAVLVLGIIGNRIAVGIARMVVTRIERIGAAFDLGAVVYAAVISVALVRD